MATCSPFRWVMDDQEATRELRTPNFDFVQTSGAEITTIAWFISCDRKTKLLFTLRKYYGINIFHLSNITERKIKEVSFIQLASIELLHLLINLLFSQIVLYIGIISFTKLNC
jgi:hypothetical protein